MTFPPPCPYCNKHNPNVVHLYNWWDADYDGEIAHSFRFYGYGINYYGCRICNHRFIHRHGDVMFYDIDNRKEFQFYDEIVDVPEPMRKLNEELKNKQKPQIVPDAEFLEFFRNRKKS